MMDGKSSMFLASTHDKRTDDCKFACDHLALLYFFRLGSFAPNRQVVMQSRTHLEMRLPRRAEIVKGFSLRFFFIES